ncbi:beta/gamma crystallin domain-containing protein [Spongiactinospora sp. 9N601]|uniref:beta/gamma crystallin domain-containing protein n=1 Tax=Spongiactinospora sp. 9N601 TaxID=3375149 RepID=UPI0037BA68F3
MIIMMVPKTAKVLKGETVKTLFRGVLGAAAAALTVLVTVPATPAYATNAVRCPSWVGSEYLEFHNSDKLCFANGGSLSVAIYGVHTVWSGNNRVRYAFQRHIGGPVEWGQIDRRNAAAYHSPAIHQVTAIQIY